LSIFSKASLSLSDKFFFIFSRNSFLASCDLPAKTVFLPKTFIPLFNPFCLTSPSTLNDLPSTFIVVSGVVPPST
jgi:hypothetical protein